MAMQRSVHVNAAQRRDGAMGACMDAWALFVRVCMDAWMLLVRLCVCMRVVQSVPQRPTAPILDTKP
jgi:hypothetical protein